MLIHNYKIMKIIKLVALCVLFMLSYGCNKIDSGDVSLVFENSPKVVPYYLLLNIQDISGKNRIEGIGYDENSGSIKSDLYKWAVFQGGEFSSLTLYKTEENESLLLTVCGPKQIKINAVIHKFSCPYVFGDNLEHTIITSWEFIDSSTHAVCTYFVIDGKVYPAMQNKGHFFSTVSIVLDDN